MQEVSGKKNMSNTAEPWLASYIQAWQRHRIHFCLHPPLALDADRLPQPLARAGGAPPEGSAAVAVSGGPLTYRFSYAHHDREKRGERNGGFLDPGVLEEVLLPAVEALAPRATLVMFRLAPVYATEGLPASAFLEKLDRFLSGLPSVRRYAVGVRNPEFLLPDYRACLQGHGVAHLFDEAVMPLLDQVQIPGIFSGEPVVCRSTPGFRRAPVVEGEWELGAAEIVRRCLAEKKTCSLYLDEQTSEVSLEALMSMLNADLARLSPIRKKAA